MGQIPPAFVINLDRSPQRLALVRDRFEPTGIEISRFAGIDAALQADRVAAAVDQTSFENYMHRPATPGEVGCALSHFALWDRLAESDAEAFLILEDDAAPTEHFSAIPQIMDTLPDDWELCLLSSVGRLPLWSGRAGDVTVHRYWRPDYIGAGYLVHRRILRHRHAWPPHGRLPFMFDAWRYWAWRYGVAIYAAIPMPVRQDTAVESTIDRSGNGRVKRRRGLAAAMQSHLTRFGLYPRGIWHAARAWWRLRAQGAGQSASQG